MTHPTVIEGPFDVQLLIEALQNLTPHKTVLVNDNHIAKITVWGDYVTLYEPGMDEP